MIQTKSKVIDGKEYAVRQLPAGRAQTINWRLGKFISRGLSQSSGDLSLDGQTLATVGGAVYAAMQELDPAEVLAMSKEVLDGAKCDGKNIAFDDHFAGSMMHLWKVVAFAMEANFGDFGDVLAVLRAAGQARTPSASKE